MSAFSASTPIPGRSAVNTGASESAELEQLTQSLQERLVNSGEWARLMKHLRKSLEKSEWEDNLKSYARGECRKPLLSNFDYRPSAGLIIVLLYCQTKRENAMVKYISTRWLLLSNRKLNVSRVTIGPRRTS